jgi:hypothetical protein
MVENGVASYKIQKYRKKGAGATKSQKVQEQRAQNAHFRAIANQGMIM